MSKVKELQKANLGSPEQLAKVKAKDIMSMFTDEKVAKQIISAARRTSKKRAAGDDVTPSPRKKRKESLFSEDIIQPAELEASVALPESSATADELTDTVVFTNRAPLVLAFVVTLLKHTMPEQPLSSRLSLAQGYVSTTSRARAVSLGIQEVTKDEEAQEKNLGEGQPSVTIMGKELKTLRRWGYEWRDKKADAEASTQGTLKGDSQLEADALKIEDEESSERVRSNTEDKPALWALDLEALRKSNRTALPLANTSTAAHSNLPIYTPQSARAYLLKSFDSAPAAGGGTAKKPPAAAKMAQKERNLGSLLRVLEMLYESWADALNPDELDKRTWSWYVKVRPDVAHGAAGWGGKNEVKLADILALRRQS